MGATANKSYGYFAGGGDPSVESTVDRLDFINDTTNTVTKGPLPYTIQQQGAAGNEDFAYHAGGGPSVRSTISRIDYANDTVTAVEKGWIEQRLTGAYGTGSTSYGYFAGGTEPSPANRSDIKRMDYSNDTAGATRVCNMFVGRYGAPGVSSRNNVLAGVKSWTESVGPITRQYFGPSERVYIMGGTTSPADISHPGGSCRYDIPTSTVTASIRSVPVKPARNYKGASNSTPDYGYLGGNSPANIERYDYANDNTATTPKGALSGTKYSRGTAGNINYGYWAGGMPPYISTIERLDYANDTAAAAVRGPLTAALAYLTGAGNHNYGYIGCPNTPASTTIYRIDYSNDLLDTSPRSVLTTTATNKKATGNKDYGWWIGGASTTIVARLDYGNDTTVMSPRGNLSVSHSNLGSASGNAFYGIYSYGFPNTTSVIDRIDFANDTATSVGQHGIWLFNYGSTSVCGGMNGLPQPGT